jgi:hypothetical protein
VARKWHGDDDTQTKHATSEASNRQAFDHATFPSMAGEPHSPHETLPPDHPARVVVKMLADREVTDRVIDAAFAQSLGINRPRLFVTDPHEAALEQMVCGLIEEPGHRRQVEVQQAATRAVRQAMHPSEQHARRLARLVSAALRNITAIRPRAPRRATGRPPVRLAIRSLVAAPAAPPVHT